jgi:F-type H+-transporting ATPase subunit a
MSALGLPVLASGDVISHLTNSYQMDIGPLRIDFRALNALVGFDLHITKHVFMMMVVAAVLGTVGIVVGRRAASGAKPGLLGHSVESVVLFLRDQVVRPNIGEHHAHAYLPLFVTFFFFILLCNLMGLLPQSATATGNHNVTLALALVTLGTMLGGGMMEKGVFGYWVSIVPHGVPWWMWPIIWPIELIGHFTKPFALTVRLFANMTAGHVILGVLGGFLMADVALGMKAMIVPPTIGFALFITVFEVLVAFIQAFIFTTLSSIFVGMCISHEH